MNPLQLLLNKIHKRDLWERDLLLNRNEYLKVKGSTDTNIYWIESGSLRIFLEDEDEEQTIRFAYQDNLIAALDSYISEKPSELYIQALKQTSLKLISKQSFVEFIHSSSENLQLWLQVVEQLVLQQLEREQDILTSSPTKRYERVLKRSPQLFQEVPHKYIASYLRMTPETLSRIKKS